MRSPALSLSVALLAPMALPPPAAAPPAAVPLPVTLPSISAPGPVRDLTFEPTDEGWLIRWRAPAGLEATDLRYELEDRGVGDWRPVHRGPETRLRVLQARHGACRLRVRAIDAVGEAGPWSEIDCAVDVDRPAPAKASGEQPACRDTETVACLLDRFAVVVHWGDRADGRRPAHPSAPEAADARDFAFGARIGALTVRVFDACEPSGFFGVEYDGRSDAEFVLEVTDTVHGQTKSFLAPAGRDRPASVRYTQVFATCDARRPA